jgi:type I restriction enzyme M protein
LAYDNDAESGFEKTNGDAARHPRGDVGLIFIKYISERFEARHREVEEDDGFEGDMDARAERYIFFAPPSAGWPDIAAYA